VSSRRTVIVIVAVVIAALAGVATYSYLSTVQDRANKHAKLVKVFVVKKIDASANTVTLDANSTEVIDGALTVVIGTQYQSYNIVSNNSAWYIF